jgi:hypothetical protein
VVLVVLEFLDKVLRVVQIHRQPQHLIPAGVAAELVLLVETVLVGMAVQAGTDLLTQLQGRQHIMQGAAVVLVTALLLVV